MKDLPTTEMSRSRGALWLLFLLSSAVALFMATAMVWKVQFGRFEDICRNVSIVTVVGNGPLSHADRLSISRSECVVRFNDAPGYRKGEPFYALVLREHTMHLSAVAMYGGSPYIWTIPVISDKKQLAPLTGRATAPIYISQFQYGTPAYTNLTLFPGCKGSKAQNETRKGPSTGCAFINHVQTYRDDVERVHVYGMNWNDTNLHVDFKYKRLVRECCTKCVIHHTSSSEYKGGR